MRSRTSSCSVSPARNWFLSSLRSYGAGTLGSVGWAWSLPFCYFMERIKMDGNKRFLGHFSSIFYLHGLSLVYYGFRFCDFSGFPFFLYVCLCRCVSVLLCFLLLLFWFICLFFFTKEKIKDAVEWVDR